MSHLRLRPFGMVKRSITATVRPHSTSSIRRTSTRFRRNTALTASYRYKVDQEESAPEVLENSTFSSFGEVIFSDEEDEELTITTEVDGRSTMNLSSSESSDEKNVITRMRVQSMCYVQSGTDFVGDTSIWCLTYKEDGRLNSRTYLGLLRCAMPQRGSVPGTLDQQRSTRIGDRRKS